MVERRKNNWLVRQLSRMGSMRSQSTAYSSGGIAFNRNRLNSVYSSPEAGLPMSTILHQQQLQAHSQLSHQQQSQQLQQHQQLQQPNQQQHHLQQQQQLQHHLQIQQQLQSKPSLYEKFVHRKSLRAQRQLIKQSK